MVEALTGEEAPVEGENRGKGESSVWDLPHQPLNSVRHVVAGSRTRGGSRPVTCPPVTVRPRMDTPGTGPRTNCPSPSIREDGDRETIEYLGVVKIYLLLQEDPH